MKPFRIAHVTLCAMLCCASIGNAQSENLIDFGVFTRDPATGLDWLDLTATQNLSFIEVSARFGLGGTFAGYRYATVAEVRTLWQNAGLTNGTYSPEIREGEQYFFAEQYPVAAVENLVRLVGFTWDMGNGVTQSLGLTSTPYTVGGSYRSYATPQLNIYGPQNVANALVVQGLRDYVAADNYGSWLVRDSASVTPVPEPQSYATLLAGLGLLGAYLRNRHVAIGGASRPRALPNAGGKHPRQSVLDL